MNKILPIVLFLLVLVSILLSYWYFFPNSQAFPSLSRPKPIVETITPKNQSSSKQNIAVKSKIEGINIQLHNEMGLRELLTKLNFWQQNAVGVNKSGSINWTTPHSLRIIIVPEKQTWGGVYSRTQQSDTSNFGIDTPSDGVVDLRLWFEPDQARDEAKLESLINKTLLLALFDITHWTEHSEVNTEYIEFLNLSQQDYLNSEESFPIKIVIDNNKQ